MYKLVLKAINFAAQKHHGQERRDSGIAYIIHPVSVMHILDSFKQSKHIEELKAAALLHDTLEDTECNYHELEREFSPFIASLVLELSSDEVSIQKIGKKEYIKQKMFKMSKYALVIKLADRLANIYDSPSKKYVEDTIETMDFLLKNREELSETQKKLMNEILSVCKSLQQNR